MPVSRPATARSCSFSTPTTCSTPTIVARVVAAFARQPMRRKRSSGCGRWTPRRRAWRCRAACASDAAMRRLAVSSRQWPGYTYAPTSGNAYAAAALRHILPLPETLPFMWPDMFLALTSALCGPVIALEDCAARTASTQKISISMPRSIWSGYSAIWPMPARVTRASSSSPIVWASRVSSAAGRHARCWIPDRAHGVAQARSDAPPNHGGSRARAGLARRPRGRDRPRIAPNSSRAQHGRLAAMLGPRAAGRGACPRIC